VAKQKRDNHTYYSLWKGETWTLTAAAGWAILTSVWAVQMEVSVYRDNFSASALPLRGIVFTVIILITCEDGFREDALLEVQLLFEPTNSSLNGHGSFEFQALQLS
jgi:hypothetical protein